MINPIGIQKHVGKKWTVVLAVLSFIIPLAAWSVVSYVPFVYHPLVKVVDAGGSMFCQPGDEIERANFEEENKTRCLVLRKYTPLCKNRIPRLFAVEPRRRAAGHYLRRNPVL